MALLTFFKLCIWYLIAQCTTFKLHYFAEFYTKMRLEMTGGFLNLCFMIGANLESRYEIRICASIGSCWYKKRNISLVGWKCSKKANPIPQQSPKNVNRIVLLHLWASFSRNYRSNRPEVFCKNGVLRNFAKLTGKQREKRKKRLWHRCLFSCEFCEIFRNTFFHITPLVAASGITLNG